MSNRAQERENNLVQSIILFAIFFVIFVGGIFAMSFLSLSNAWPMAIALGLCFVGLVIPLTWLNKSDSGAK
ncbi:hypothetical protein IV500_02790 [Paeniglutamicibacter antarcticus]|uniref:Uncharacterized protein n=1 Tax=Arthrobacter terrae TaxID=2935737 RepID=A0A931G426_9MICC|nr:hypothetical protein [Arthrobacter terrae]MBG0738358.1 hypothetical protein [Arthrobacter terrae]